LGASDNEELGVLSLARWRRASPDKVFELVLDVPSYPSAFGQQQSHLGVR
jgi:hypothetical protein